MFFRFAYGSSGHNVLEAKLLYMYCMYSL